MLPVLSTDLIIANTFGASGRFPAASETRKPILSSTVTEAVLPGCGLLNGTIWLVVVTSGVRVSALRSALRSSLEFDCYLRDTDSDQ
jgi:hypothetical protein